MDSMEFVMGNSLETLPKTIDFNFEDLKTELGRSLSYYNGLVVTEDDIKSAKDDRAKLNKLREALENKRKEVKKECMAPYTDFENKVKELVGLTRRHAAARRRLPARWWTTPWPLTTTNTGSTATCAPICAAPS